MENILVEVCCGSLEDAISAEKSGADRIELNSCLFQGGLTPSLGTLIEAKKRLSIPIMAMVRPRGAGFCYSEYDICVMLRDAELFIRNGADGIVFGFLNYDGTVDIKNVELMVKIANGKETVFHRAFDVVPDPLKAVDQLAEAGITRILTSGQEASVREGIPLIRELVKYAGNKIQIMPGGSIVLSNVAKIVKETAASQIHTAAFSIRYDHSTEGNPKIFYGGALYPPEDRYETGNSEMIAQIVSKAKMCSEEI